MPPTPSLRVRKLADTSEGERVVRFDQRTGEKILVNPANVDPDGQIGGEHHEPWPLLGLAIEGDAPRVCRVPTSFVVRGQGEGWLELENARMEFRPGGPPEDPYRVTHAFTHADALVLKCVDGDVRYSITHQPDKYADEGTDKTPVTDLVYAAGDTRVDWFYDLKLED